MSSGLGRAHVFMAQPHYQEQFKKVLEVGAWPGTLNLDMNKSSLSDYQNLRILSGLYGILKPLDVIEPYRLEMGTKLKTNKGSDLYDFWGKHISKEIEKELNRMKSKTLINLASNEYYDSVQSLSEDIKVIAPIFKDKGKDGKYKIISFYAKKARGYMASWLIKNQINKEKDISSFSEEGYKFSIEDSQSGSPVFLRG